MERNKMDKNTTMENLARAAYEKGGFNGAWLYAEKGKIVSSGAFGWVDAENSLPMREDSIFEMASVTKMFTATAIMLLVREGKLGLDDAYTKYFPDYPYEGVTIRHLLTHTTSKFKPVVSLGMTSDSCSRSKCRRFGSAGGS